MYCTKCGKLNENDARFCTACGAPIGQRAAQESQAQKAYYESRNGFNEAPSQAKTAGDPEKSSVLGVIAMVFAFVMPLIGLILGLIDYNTRDGYNKNLSKWAIIVSGIILVLRIILSIVLSAIYSRMIADFVRFFM